MTSDRDSYEEIALAVGDVCLQWASIEGVVHDIILHLAAVMHPEMWDRNRKAWDLLHITLSQMDIRQKIAVAKVYAHHIVNPDPPDFYDRTEELLNYIDNEVRPERNHYVHDVWETDGADIVRSKLGAKVQRPQSHQRIATIWTERRYKDRRAIREFVNNLELAYADLVDLDNVTVNLDLPRERRGSHPSQFPQEWRSLVHREWRGPNTPRPQP